MTKSEFKSFYRKLRIDAALNIGFENVRASYDYDLVSQCVKNRLPNTLTPDPLPAFIKGLKAGGAVINKDSRTFTIFGKTSDIFYY